MRVRKEPFFQRKKAAAAEAKESSKKAVQTIYTIPVDFFPNIFSITRLSLLTE